MKIRVTVMTFLVGVFAAVSVTGARADQMDRLFAQFNDQMRAANYTSAEWLANRPPGRGRQPQ